MRENIKNKKVSILIIFGIVFMVASIILSKINNISMKINFNALAGISFLPISIGLILFSIRIKNKNPIVRIIILLFAIFLSLAFIVSFLELLFNCF